MEPAPRTEPVRDEENGRSTQREREATVEEPHTSTRNLRAKDPWNRRQPDTGHLHIV